MTEDQRKREMESAVSRLSEIFDSVQIVGTYVDSAGATRGIKRGAGNWYARKALCEEFATEADQQNQAELIAEQLSPPDEDWSEL